MLAFTEGEAAIWWVLLCGGANCCAACCACITMSRCGSFMNSPGRTWFIIFEPEPEPDTDVFTGGGRSESLVDLIIGSVCNPGAQLNLLLSNAAL